MFTVKIIWWQSKQQLTDKSERNGGLNTTFRWNLHYSIVEDFFIVFKKGRINILIKFRGTMVPWMTPRLKIWTVFFPWDNKIYTGWRQWNYQAEAENVKRNWNTQWIMFLCCKSKMDAYGCRVSEILELFNAWVILN